MLYELEQGPTEQFLIDQCERSRRPLPSIIANKPVLAPHLYAYYHAWNVLSSCRMSVPGFGMGRIPWTAVMEFARFRRLDGETLDILWDLICRLDSVYINHEAEKTKLQRGAADRAAQVNGTAIGSS